MNWWMTSLENDRWQQQWQRQQKITAKARKSEREVVRLNPFKFYLDLIITSFGECEKEECANGWVFRRITTSVDNHRRLNFWQCEFQLKTHTHNTEQSNRRKKKQQNKTKTKEQLEEFRKEEEKRRTHCGWREMWKIQARVSFSSRRELIRLKRLTFQRLTPSQQNELQKKTHTHHTLTTNSLNIHFSYGKFLWN